MPGAGVEPAWAFKSPRDFKSLVSTNFTIRAEREILRKLPSKVAGGHKGLRPSSWLRLIAPTYQFHHPGNTAILRKSAKPCPTIATPQANLRKSHLMPHSDDVTDLIVIWYKTFLSNRSETDNFQTGSEARQSLTATFLDRRPLVVYRHAEEFFNRFYSVAGHARRCNVITATHE